MRYVAITSMVLLSTFISLVVSAEAVESFGKAFIDATRADNSAAKDSHLQAWALSRHEKAGADLAAKYPDVDIKLLEERLKNTEDASVRSLAWVTLAKLSERKDAREIVYRRALTGDKLAILSVSFMPGKTRNEVAESIAIQGKTWECRTDMIELLSYIGDANSLKVLNELVELNKTGNVRQAAIKSMPCIHEKLKQPATEQVMWSQCGLRFWQATREIERPCNLYGEFPWIVNRIGSSGMKCPISFLRYRINSGDTIAIMLAGIQKESQLIECLGAATDTDSALQRGGAIESLIQIGNKDAMNELFKHLKPSAQEENRRILQILADCETSASVELLEQLIEDKEYRDLWPAIKQAIAGHKERQRLAPKNNLQPRK
jgi:HEAT repeat protein